MLISRYNWLRVPLMHKTCWLFRLETKKQEKSKSEEPHVCPLGQPAGSSSFLKNQMCQFVIVQSCVRLWKTNLEANFRPFAQVTMKSSI